MWQSPVVPSILTSLVMIMGCQAIEISKTTPHTSSMKIEKQFFQFCPKGTIFIQRKNKSILCGKLKNEHYTELSILKKITKNKYELLYSWPKEQYFQYSKKKWNEKTPIFIESNYFYLLTTRSLEWQCDTTGVCLLSTIPCSGDKPTTSLFPSIVEKIRDYTANKKHQNKNLNEHTYSRLLYEAVRGNYQAYKILIKHDQWIEKKSNQKNIASYFKKLLFEKNTKECIFSSSSFWNTES